MQGPTKRQAQVREHRVVKALRRRDLDRDAARGGIVRSRFLRALQISFLTRRREVTLRGGMACVLKNRG
jgi:hypothetical protein